MKNQLKRLKSNLASSGKEPFLWDDSVYAAEAKGQIFSRQLPEAKLKKEILVEEKGKK